MTDRPNVLLVMADQLADSWLDVAHTPALDQIAAEGVRFTSAYTTSPLCAPSRSAMLTGRLNSTIGAYDNAAELSSSVPTIAHHLRSAGYQTALVGKMHFVGADQLHGYEERLTTDIYPADFDWTPDWAHPEERVDWWYHNMGSVTGAGVAEVTNQLDFDDEVGFQALRKMRDLARSKDRRPWFLTVSFTHPHDPYVTRRRFWDLYDHNTIPMPAVTEVDDPDPHSLRIASAIEADRVHPDEEAVRTARHAYLANVSYVDSLVGELLDTMDRLGMGDDTTLVFTSDHGDMLGERGLWYKMSFFDHSARVPLILKSPGLTPSVVGTPVSHLDLLPTLTDLVEVDPHEETIGSSLVGVADGTEPDRTVVGEYMAEGSVAPMFMIRRGSEKFVWSEPDPPQLYDLSSDPHELVNLAPTSPKTTVFEAEMHERWDVEAIDRSVRRSQTERHLVAHANRQGRYTPWEHQPRVDASEQYMRNHLDLNEVESGRRL